VARAILLAVHVPGFNHGREAELNAISEQPIALVRKRSRLPGGRLPLTPLLFALGLAAALVLSWAVPGKAGAATQLGQVAPADHPGADTTGNFVQFQATTAPYAVPAPGGVITSWSHRGRTPSAGSGRLQVWSQVGENTFSLADRSALETFTAGIVNSFSTRIPVTGGRLLGLRTVGAGHIYPTSVSSDEFYLLSGDDPAPG
jgi:hypothetical protein